MSKSLYILTIFACASLLLAGCGRKGALEPAPSTAVSTGDNSPAQAAPQQDKPFILDRLIQ